ncbi:MAG: creatininase family protein [candidate division NC10 bacterium]|nr:creatininase family protein [candidate division NC10 bacterium]
MVALRQAAQALVEEQEDLKILVLCPYEIPLPFLDEREIQRYGHAGALETSALLAINENLVGNEIPPVPRPAFPPFQVLAHPEACFPSGILGDPTKASRELGEKILSHFVSEITKLLE